jgi:hypothetical protein
MTSRCSSASGDGNLFASTSRRQRYSEAVPREGAIDLPPGLVGGHANIVAGDANLNLNAVCVQGSAAAAVKKALTASSAWVRYVAMQS